MGLGNPGTDYANNRHNIGFMAVDAIAEARRFGPFRARHQGLMTDGLIGDERVMLLKPQTYMNDSGRSVGEALRYAKLDLGALVVIHDELDLAPGKVRVKVGGGDAGHGIRAAVDDAVEVDEEQEGHRADASGARLREPIGAPR